MGQLFIHRHHVKKSLRNGFECWFNTNMSSQDQLYTEALHFIADLPTDHNTLNLVTRAERLEMYGLREVILRGPCNTKGPRYAFSTMDTVKWKSWRDAGNISSEEAKSLFIAKTITFLKRLPTDERAQKLLKILDVGQAKL